ncbi:MAG TPA: peroxiredoxin [Acidimicrobiales bacterium]|nr:peroxiredoxin [Acidimicrobiales bacterium]
MLGVGETAPDFSLEGSDGTEEGRRTYSRSEFAGQPVVLVFYPGDNTPVCTRQLNAYTDDIDAFQQVGAQVLAISPQDVESHDRFSEKQGGFAFPLLADPDKIVGEAYDILGPIGFYRRSAFVISPDGTIVYAHRAIAGLTFRPTEELIAAIEAAVD